MSYNTLYDNGKDQVSNYSELIKSKSSRRQKNKTILKKKSSSHSSFQQMNPTQDHISWDEEIIKQHNQLRGTRMKIAEPNTPYFHLQESSEDLNDDTLPLDELNYRLRLLALKSSSSDSSIPLIESDDNLLLRKLPSEDSIGSHQQESISKRFEEQRKRHYNEYQMMQKFKERHKDQLLSDNSSD